ACESPVSTATCAALGFPTTHPAAGTPGNPRMHGGGKLLERCSESGWSDGGGRPTFRPGRTAGRHARTALATGPAPAGGWRPAGGGAGGRGGGGGGGRRGAGPRGAAPRGAPPAKSTPTNGAPPPPAPPPAVTRLRDGTRRIRRPGVSTR